jgi:type II secretory pathway pseudopilin PulG
MNGAHRLVEPAGVRTSSMPTWRRSTRPAMTLVEIMVAVGATSMLVALLVPALGNARDVARRTACLANLSGLGKAIAAHESAQGVLPGWRNTIEPFTTVRCRSNATRSQACVSWTVTLMPYLGEKELFGWYESFTGLQGVEDATRKTVSRFVCPAVPRRESDQARLSYAANGGTGAEAIKSNGQQYRGDGVLTDTAGNLQSAAWFSGGGKQRAYAPLKNSLSQIADGDGLTATLLFAERCGEAAPSDVVWSACPPAAVPNAGKDAAQEVHAILHPKGIYPGMGPPGGGNSQRATDNTWMKVGKDSGLRYPSSVHGADFGAVFCDGSTRIVTTVLDAWVYSQLLSSDPRDLSQRVAMLQRRPVGGRNYADYVFDEADLAKR